ncbi:MAG: transporter substrate-binding domain-containing protein [Clostridia bacterium]|nr:transporter substrate-binding domain-containing protein [Clostridia bacterium]
MRKKAVAVIMCILMLSCLLISCIDNKSALKCIEIQLTSEHYAYGVNKNDNELLNAANELLAEIKSDGTLDEIINKYFSNDTSKIKTFTKGEELPCKDQLIVATHAPFSPFEYTIGDRYCGIDMEIASLLAEKLNRELVIKEYPFNDIISAVENGEADIVMAGLTVSSDREKQIAFTDTYFEASQMIIAKEADTTFDECKTTDDVLEILRKMNKSTKIGYQKDTVSDYFICGNMELGFTGYNSDRAGYSSAFDAAKALQKGEIDYVIVDGAPGKMIVNQLNNSK